MPPRSPIAIHLRAAPRPSDAADGEIALLAGADGAPVTLRWADALQQDLEHLQRHQVDAERLKRIGARLAELAEPAGWREGAAAVREASAAGAGVVVQVVSDSPEVHALPWELLPFPQGGGLLGELPGALLHGTWPGTATAPPRAVSPSSGALLAWSSAGGAVPEVVLTEALRKAPAFRGFSPGRDVLPDASLSTLARALTNAEQEGRPYAALVLLCHVVPDAHGAAALALSAPGGGVSVVEDEDLRRALRPFASSLRLVTLLLCEGSEPGPHGLRCAPLALGLHRAGHRAVVGLRFSLSVRSVCAWSLAFFAQLKHLERDLTRATLAGRAALGSDERGADWSSPLLLARSADLEAIAAPTELWPTPSSRGAIAAGLALLALGLVVALWGLPRGDPGQGAPEPAEGASFEAALAQEAPPELPVGVALSFLEKDSGVHPVLLRAALEERDFTPCLRDAPPLERTGVVGRVMWFEDDAEGELSAWTAVGPGEGIEDCVLEQIGELDREALGATGPLGFGLAVLAADSKWVTGDVGVRLEASGGTYGKVKRAAVNDQIQGMHDALTGCLTGPGVDAFTASGNAMGRQVSADWSVQIEVAEDGTLTDLQIPGWGAAAPPPPCLAELLSQMTLPPQEAPQSLRISLVNRASADPSLR